MDCRTASLLIEAYNDDELQLVEAAHLLAHLEACPTCRERRDEAARLKDAVRSGRPVDRCPEELARRLSRCVELPARSRRRSFRPLVIVLVGGCGVLVGWASSRFAPAIGRGALAFASPRQTFDADVFCLRCALRALFPAGAKETGPHRPMLRTADGRIWIIRPDSAAQFRETSSQPRHVVVTAALDERTGLADVSSVSDVSVDQPAAR